MIQIVKATQKDAKLLSKLSIASFLVPHGHSAPKVAIDNYVSSNFSEENFVNELSNSNFQYYLMYYKEEVAGFSKVIFNTENENIVAKNTTKMERLYLLKEFYNLGLGKTFMHFNIQLAKQQQQAGIWLAVWVENPRAIAFYKKTGFKIVGAYDFPISKTHSNPNHILYLEF
ncbi:GNAT family N-acetyltransferase [uncultured Polaribacter sp.]|uniref:GNAT family N-acetyltransferase n=1 Tax=uncultured Polaribacter sp. TaxID=174711 RepID=UPI00260711CE|nr:GNAT family N-acetyltransferase [uncultured Polaribacter sp.]